MSTRNGLTRRQFLARLGLGSAALFVAACAPARPPTATPVPPTPTKAPVATPLAVATATPTPPVRELEGEVVVSLQGANTQTWQALADAYMKRNPKVQVHVELKPPAGYPEWIRTQFAVGEPRASWLNINVVADLIAARKFLNLEDYLDRSNPYNMGKKWRESFDEEVMFLSRDPVTRELHHLSLEMVQIIWFYNKDIAAEIGMAKPPETWDELAAEMEKARKAGYIPFAIGGDYAEFWEMRIGWLARMYQDGFYCAPEKWELSRCQPGDWCFEKGKDDKFPAANWRQDRRFDDGNRVSQNTVRWLNAFRDGKIGPKDREYRALMREFKKVFRPENLPPGWTGVSGSTAYTLFLSGKALFWLDGSWMLPRFEKDIEALRTGTFFRPIEGTPTPTPDPHFAAIKPFAFGTFNNPRMVAPEATCPWQRTIEWPVGFWGVPIKSAKQNDLEIDFMMFVTSPEGYRIFVETNLDPNNPAGGLAGVPIVKGVELPPEIAAKFAGLRPVGNTEKATAGSIFSRGIADYPPMVREWVSLAQQYFTDQIDLDTYISRYDDMLRRPDHWKGLLEHMKLTEDDLANPEREPLR
jgi:ABC-type glycerol-3-phosphate transport system substrate-binding protein